MLENERLKIFEMKNEPRNYESQSESSLKIYLMTNWLESSPWFIERAF